MKQAGREGRGGGRDVARKQAGREGRGGEGCCEEAGRERGEGRGGMLQGSRQGGREGCVREEDMSACHRDPPSTPPANGYTAA